MTELTEEDLAKLLKELGPDLFYSAQRFAAELRQQRKEAEKRAKEHEIAIFGDTPITIEELQKMERDAIECSSWYKEEQLILKEQSEIKEKKINEYETIRQLTLEKFLSKGEKIRKNYDAIGKHIDARMDRNRYIQIKKPTHPFASKKGYVLEHRSICEEWLRINEPEHPGLIEINGTKYLRREYEVHHCNRNRSDNRIENLVPLHGSVHNGVYNLKRISKMVDSGELSFKDYRKIYPIIYPKKPKKEKNERNPMNFTGGK